MWNKKIEIYLKFYFIKNIRIKFDFLRFKILKKVKLNLSLINSKFT